jgi:hypothetical protein
MSRTPGRGKREREEGPIVRFSKFSNPRLLNEEYQNTDFYFAFMSRQRNMCHEWVKCRDFLQDALRARYGVEQEKLIYGFGYNKDNPRIDISSTRMLVSGNRGSTTFGKAVLNGVRIVNLYEDAHKLTPRTKAIRAVCEEDENIHAYVLIGPGEWSQGYAMISLYTLLIRIGYYGLEFDDKRSLHSALYKFASEEASRDARYIAKVKDKIDAVIENRSLLAVKSAGWKEGDKLLFQDATVHLLHNRSGIVAHANCATPDKELNDKLIEIFNKINTEEEKEKCQDPPLEQIRSSS